MGPQAGELLRPQLRLLSQLSSCSLPMNSPSSLRPDTGICLYGFDCAFILFGKERALRRLYHLNFGAFAAWLRCCLYNLAAHYHSWVVASVPPSPCACAAGLVASYSHRLQCVASCACTAFPGEHQSPLALTHPQGQVSWWKVSQKNNPLLCYVCRPCLQSLYLTIHCIATCLLLLLVQMQCSCKSLLTQTGHGARKEQPPGPVILEHMHANEQDTRFPIAV